MKKTLYLLGFVALVSLIASCSKKAEIPSDSTNLVTLFDAGDDALDLQLETQTWHYSPENIFVLYGYGYNEEEFVSKMNKKLYEKYGSAENGGLIYSLVFPDDFKRGSKYYVSSLTSYLSDLNLKGIVILGAPEGTCTALGRIQESYDGKMPFPVFSLFSQDDVLGMEYCSDFVLDRAQKAEINGIIKNEEDETFVEEVPEILSQAVLCLRNSDGPYEKNSKLFEVVKRITGDIKTGRYYDPETNLPSINHFVLE
ncbi:MAG: DUF3798 domain-containing protein [Treponema sp.]|nr:DUF3798 domain-containing protein [Treponema sp.]